MDAGTVEGQTIRAALAGARPSDFRDARNLVSTPRPHIGMRMCMSRWPCHLRRALGAGTAAGGTGRWAIVTLLIGQRSPHDPGSTRTIPHYPPDARHLRSVRARSPLGRRRRPPKHLRDRYRYRHRRHAVALSVSTLTGISHGKPLRETNHSSRQPSPNHRSGFLPSGRPCAVPQAHSTRLGARPQTGSCSASGSPGALAMSRQRISDLLGGVTRQTSKGDARLAWR